MQVVGGTHSGAIVELLGRSAVLPSAWSVKIGGLPVTVRDVRLHRKVASGAGSEEGATTPSGAPRSESDYIITEDYERRLHDTYFGEGRSSSSRTTPQTALIPPVGTWRMERYGGADGHEIQQLLELPVDNIEISEDTGPEKREDVKRFAEWWRDGREPPPINVIQTDTGRLKTQDHRRLLAAKVLGKRTIKAWVNWTVPSKRADYGGPTGLTYELALDGAKPQPVVAARPDMTITVDDARRVQQIREELGIQDESEVVPEDEQGTLRDRWNNASRAEREAWLKRAGWRTNNDTLNSVGKQLIAKTWAGILPETRAILERHAQPAATPEAQPTQESRPEEPEGAAEAVRKHNLPEGTRWERGRGPIKDKWAAGADDTQSNYHATADEAAAELRRFLDIKQRGASKQRGREQAARSAADKIKRGEQPTEGELAAIFPGWREGDRYVRQPDATWFLSEYLGVPKHNIRKNIGAAAGTVTSDMGAKYPIVYPRKLAQVFGPKVRPTTPEAQQPAPAEQSGAQGVAQRDRGGSPLDGAAREPGPDLAAEERGVYAVTEPDAVSGDRYDNVVQAALSDEARGAATGVREPSTENGDVQPAAALSVRPAPGVPGLYRVTTQLVAVGERRLPRARVRSLIDAATIFAYLSDYAVEHYDALVTDADGVPLALIGNFKGATSQVSVPLATIMGELSRIDGAAHLWTAHNHPTGTPDLSNADVQLSQQIANALDGSGVEYRGLMALARGAEGNVRFTSEQSPRPVSVPTDLPVVARVPIVDRIIAQRDPGERVTAPDIARRLVPSVARAQPGIVFLDFQHRVTAFVPFAPQDMRPLRRDGRLMRLFRAASESGAAAALVAMPDGQVTPEQFRNLRNALSVVDVNVLDGVRYDSATGQARATVAETHGLGPAEAAFEDRTDSDADFARDVLNELAAADEAFRFPVSTAQSLSDVIRDVLPDHTYEGDATRPDEHQESGAERRSLFRTQDGTDYYVYERDRDVWIDVSRLQEGEGGAGVYAAVLNWAHNTGRTLIGDPAGLSEAAIVRRTWAMLASALRFGTTRHMEAAAEQRAGVPERGIAPLAWRGDDAAKTSALIESALATLTAQNPDVSQFRFDFKRGEFVDAAGNVVDRGRFVAGAERGTARAARSGQTTLRAGILIRSLVSSESGARPRILEAFLRGSRALAQGPLRGLFDRTPSGEGAIEAIDAVLPPAVQPAYVATPKQLATAFRKWEAGQIGDEQFRLAVRAEIERRQDRRLLRGARVRGAEWLRERLIRARRTSELSAEQVNLALWLIDQAPQVATDLGISIKDGNNAEANGQYEVFARVVKIFASRANDNTATHEILHHTERMMPAAVQAGIRAEWLRQLRQQVAAAREKADAGQRVMLDWMLEAAEAGQDQLALSIWKGLGGKGLSGLVDYQYAAASEYWAVNAARILRERHEATSWIERARQWLRELIAKVRALFDLPSDAAVIRGLEAVMQGDGSFVSPSMISRLGPSVAAFEDRTAARPDPETGMPQRTWQGYVERARRLIDAIDKKLDPLSSLPGYRDYLKRRYEALGEIAVSNELAENIRKAFLKATEADKHAVYDYLTTAGATTKAIGDAALRAEAERIKTRIAKIGDQLVARGLLDPDAREQYRDRYLPRLYLKHLLSEQDYRAIGTGKKLSDMGYLKQRKDIPEDVRRVLLGEIKDPGFLSAMAVSRPLRDMALIDFLAFIAERGGAQRWALTPQLVEWRGRRVTPEWLMSEAKWLRKRADYPTKEDAAAARALAAEMEQQAAEGLRALDDVADLDRYRAMPDSPRYGYLRGLLVRKEIYEDLVGVHQVRPEDLTFFENVFGYGGIGTKITQAFKTAKVALNPPAQIRNWISNMVLLQLSGVALHRLPRRLYQAIRDMRTNGTYWRIAKKYGVSEATFTANELMRLEEETLRFLKESGDISPLRRMMVLAQLFSAPVINKASDIYQAAEAWFKTAKIIDAMESDGLSEADAALEAQKWLFDYSLVPQEVRYARNAPIGAPFLTFWYKVAPRMLEVSLLHPQRLIPWVALMASLPMLAAQALDADDDEMRRFYAALPEWMRAKPHLTVLPWRDDAGRVQVMDLGYFFPWTLFTETIYNVYRGDAKAALGAPGQMVLSGPIPQLLTAIGTGVDPFTDREIAKKGDPPAQQTVAWLNFLYNMAAPPIITSNGLLSPMGLADSQYAGKLYSGLAGTTNRYGDERTTTGQAIASAMGLLSYGIDPETSRAKQLRQMAREIKDAEFRLRARMVDRGLTDEQRKRIVEEYREEMVRLSEKARQFARETGPVPTPLKRAKAAQ